jgi:diketogulonate reductase-like aldo/keto reductase
MKITDIAGGRARLGLGTCGLGEQASRRAAEVAALREAIAIGYRLFDTAEMYADGGAESVLGEAILGALRAGDVRREELCLVSKVYPHHASPEGMRRACAASLRRLGVEQIDVYLLHWRGELPLSQSLAGFAELRARGWIGACGLSNFDVADLEEWQALPGAGDEPVACATNQVYYSLAERGPEFALLPWMQRAGMPLMAYTPIERGTLAGHGVLHDVAARHGAGAAQVALAALLAVPGVLPIPKAIAPAHLRENWAAQSLTLDADDRARIDAAFPPPRRKKPLATT